MRILRWLKIPGMVIGFVSGLLVGGLAVMAGAPTISPAVKPITIPGIFSHLEMRTGYAFPDSR